MAVRAGDLGINITANNAAGATLKQLEAQIKQLQALQQNANDKSAASLQKEIDKINAQIAAIKQKTGALNSEAAAQNTVTAGIEQQTAAIEKQTAAIRAREAASRQAVSGRPEFGTVDDRATANLMNQYVKALDAAQRAEANYINQTKDLVSAKARLDAEYINRNKELEASRARQEAEYINHNKDLIAAKGRLEAEYINRNADLAYVAMRREADYMNAEFNARKRTQEKEAKGSGSSGVLGREIGHVVAGFDDLARGQKGALFSTIGAAARDAGLGVGALSTSVGILGAVMAAAAIGRKASELGEMAIKAKAAASEVGMSVSEYTALTGALALMGVKGESVDATLKHLSISLSEALANPASKSAEAFHNLQISQQDLIEKGRTLAGGLGLVADAWQRTQDGENKTANATQILGRNFKELIPGIEEGSDKLSAMEREAVKLGASLDDKAKKALTETKEAADHLSVSIEGHAIQAFTAWGPVIAGTTTLLETFTNATLTAVGAIGRFISAAAEIGGATAAASGMENMYSDTLFPFRTDDAPAKRVVGGSHAGADRDPYGAPNNKVEVPALTNPLSAREQIQLKIAKATEAAAQASKHHRDAMMAEDKAAIGVLETALKGNDLTPEDRLSIEKELVDKKRELRNSELSAADAGARSGGAAAAKAAKQSYEDFAAGERLKISEAQGSADKIIQIYTEWQNAAAGIYKQNKNVVLQIEREKVNELNKIKLDEIRETARNAELANRAAIVMGQARGISGGSTTFAGERFIGGKEPGSGQSVAALQAQAQQVEAKLQAALGPLMQIASTSSQGSEIQKNASTDILQLITQAKGQEIELYNKAAEATISAANKSTAGLQKLLDSAGNQFDQFGDALLKALIAPQTEMIKQGFTTHKESLQGNEIRQALAKMLIGGVTDAAKGVENSLSQMLASSLSSMLTIPIKAGGGISDLLGGGISKLLGIGGGAAASALPDVAKFGLDSASLATAGTGLTAAGAGLTGAATALTAAATALSASAGVSGAAGVGGAAASAAGGGIFGWLGKLLPAFSQGGIVPSAAGGMIVGGMGGTLALLHQKEMVLPAHLSEGIQGIIQNGGRGGNTANANLNYSPTINTSSRARSGTGMTRGEFSQMMASHGGAMMGEARNMMRNGWRPAG